MRGRAGAARSSARTRAPIEACCRCRR